MKKCLNTILLLPIAFGIGSSSASFYIDNQGLQDSEVQAPISDLKGAPVGFKVLSDNSYSSVHQIGSGKETKLSGFGTDMSFNDAMSMIMPDEWISYIDVAIKAPSAVDWSSQNEGWIKSLAVIGANYGYQFILDWDQKMIQVSLKDGYVEPNFDQPIVMKDTETGRSIFVYAGKPIDKEGVILVDGKVVKVRVSE